MASESQLQPWGRIRLTEEQARAAYAGLRAAELEALHEYVRVRDDGEGGDALPLKIRMRRIEQVRRKVGDLIREKGWAAPD